jgi:hypothetical protein
LPALALVHREATIVSAHPVVHAVRAKAKGQTESKQSNPSGGSLTECGHQKRRRTPLEVSHD